MRAARLGFAILLTLFAYSYADADDAKPVSKSLPVSKATAMRGLQFLNPAANWVVDDAQKIQFDSKLWQREALPDGSEIFSLLREKTKMDEQKRAVLRDGDNLSSISSYQLVAAKKGAKYQEERSASVVFHKGDLFAITQCRDDGKVLGRTCLTVTPDICEFVKSENSAATNSASTKLPDKVSEQLKVLEIQALATILTLRGSEHQLENVARLGNRLGLKYPLQTTKGKLTAKDAKVVQTTKSDAKALCAVFSIPNRTVSATH